MRQGTVCIVTTFNCENRAYTSIPPAIISTSYRSGLTEARANLTLGERQGTCWQVTNPLWG